MLTPSSAPLHREEQCKEYWRLSDYPSHIPGGSWTTFHWRRHPTSSKTQRIDYADQLRQPQAEIGFEELVSFLLDLGAVPDATGFRMLRGSGLWVPTGTPLLLSPDRHEAVLTIAPLDDSDGYLSLAVRWSSHWGMRDSSSLPPYWVLIRGEAPQRPATASSVPEKQPLLDNEQLPERDKKETVLINDTKAETQPASRTAKYTPELEEQSPALRCQVGLSGLLGAIPDDPDPTLFAPLSINHLTTQDNISTPAGIWFSSALTAHSTTSHNILWNYTIPSSLLKFCLTPSIPCGILVLLALVPESQTPEWATKYDNDVVEEREATFKRMAEMNAAVRLEASMPPAQKLAAQSERQRRSHEAFAEGQRARQRRDVQRAETRMHEALQSPKWSNDLIASHALTYLKSQSPSLVNPDHDMKRAVEIILWRMVTDTSFAEELVEVLDGWQAFVENGGMRRAEYEALKGKRAMFCFATLMVAAVGESTSAVHGSLARDLQECVRVWKRVRLG